MHLQKSIVQSSIMLSLLAMLLVISSCTDKDKSRISGRFACPDCPAAIAQGLSWNYVLASTKTFTSAADLYNIDGFETSAATVAGLQAKNTRVVCYLSAGTFEDWRPDRNNFPKAILGKKNGWRGERWLDIRQREILLPLMQARVALCKNKGFDAVEFDNVDGYRNKTGFPLSSADQLRYNRLLADIAHKEGLWVGLKNDLDQVELLEPWFDFAINEQCFEYEECDRLLPFIHAGKAVFNVEYRLPLSRFCPKARAMHFSAIRKEQDLQESVTFCPD